MRQTMKRLVLAASGALLGLIGGALLIAPKAFLATSDVYVDRDPGLMSELAAPSGILILTGALMLISAFKSRLFDLALILGAIVYGTYGVGRVISMALHGVPSDSLIAATVIELAIAGVLAGLGFSTRPDQVASEANAQMLQSSL